MSCALGESARCERADSVRAQGGADVEGWGEWVTAGEWELESGECSEGAVGVEEGVDKGRGIAPSDSATT